MKNYTISLLIVLFILLSSSCGSPGNKLVQQQLFTFGTLVDISIWTDKPEQANLIIQKVSADFERQHIDWHPAKANSQLAKINNKIQQGQVVTLESSLAYLTKIAIEFAQQSEQLFNPAIGKLVDLWHFEQLEKHSAEDIADLLQPPNKQQIKSLLDLNISMTDISLQGKQLKSQNPAVKLDFGAFAKGYAVDLAVNTIKQAGFNNALVNAGGDIKAIGTKGDKLWNIGIRNPFYQQQPGKPVMASIKLNDGESIMTSGDYERYFTYQGKRYHHIIDPRSGYPAEGFHSVTVLHKDAALADAAATALFIAGADGWKNIAKKMAVDMVMIVTQDKELIISKKLEPRLSLIDNKFNTQVVNLD